jgi:hypothetical protein
MSASLPLPGRLVAARPVRALVPALARQEARRLLLHPLTLVGWAVYVLAVLGDTVLVDAGPRAAFESATSALSFFPGILLVLSANLVATRDRRAESEEMLAPLPGRPEERLQALALASLAPAVVGLVANLGLHAYLLVDGRYFVAPTPWQLLAGPVTLVGGCLFGYLLGIWVPGRSAAVVGLAALVVTAAWVDNHGDARLFGVATSWARFGSTLEAWAGLLPGSPAMHLGYLASLCVMAFAAAWVRVADRRTPAVVLGLVALGSTMACGIAQLP